jgi:N-acetylmuramoyl-L-alanine amidase
LRNVKYSPQQVRQIIEAYWRIGKDEGVRPEVGFCQCLKETGYFTFETPNGKPGDVRPEQFNFCGLGATGGGNPGLSFTTIEDGVRAHLRHLRLYSEIDKIKAKTLNDRVTDPRGLPERLLGSAPTVEDLGGRWAPNPDYGVSIVRDYLADLLATPEPQKQTDWKQESVDWARAKGYLTSDHDPLEQIDMGTLCAVLKNMVEK